MEPTNFARPMDGYLIEPMTTGPTAFWEGHHATNPCAIRLSSDSRVFLGYRAGGWDDRFQLDQTEVWGSHLGMAVLTSDGGRVDCRLPLPLMMIERDYHLPQTADQYEEFQAGPHATAISVLHDFRLWEDGPWLYCIYHEGPLDKCFDCIVRMRTTDFLLRIEQSCSLAEMQPEQIRDAWRSLWWAEGVWQPCGTSGTNRIYESEIDKNDIVFIRLADSSLKMIHRPIPDNYLIDTEDKPFCPSTEDGILKIGTVQQSIRPGRLDNSHIGNNGMPTRAQIGSREVFVDLVHGVENYRMSNRVEEAGWDLEYRTYLRILDYESGAQLYYSDQPIFESDTKWQDSCRNGVWVSANDHLRSVMFVGGQVPIDPKKTGLDDKWFAYVGTGDTAVGLAEFTLRELLPRQVIADIEDRVDLDGPPLAADENKQILGPVEGWEFSVQNHPRSRQIAIVRELAGSGEKTARVIELRPGYNDAYAMWIEEGAVQVDQQLGWVVKTKVKSSTKAAAADGLLLLDKENPERILYRSDHQELTVPSHVADEVLYLYRHQPMRRAGIQWLAQKAAAHKTI
ncbi:MAG: hypothetical protein MK171_11130 [Pirellulales bacterium]|nr:hypothetical protein [Pirellulales bacterium]